ncbi:MAG: hypothetical protein R2854_19675 [Caldilineaceae bacterium]
MAATEAEIEINDIVGIRVGSADSPPLLHFARRLDVHIWPIKRVTTG